MTRKDERTPEQKLTHRWAIVARDKFMSGWGGASGGASRCACVSFSVRRGVARDNEENPRDAERRPWVTVEVSDVCGEDAINVLVAGLRNSEAYWLRAVEREIQEASAYLKTPNQ